MSIQLMRAIVQKAQDRDGLSSNDRAQLFKRFNPQVSGDTLDTTFRFMGDLRVTAAERVKLMNLLKLKDGSALNPLIGVDGKRVLRNHLRAVILAYHNRPTPRIEKEAYDRILHVARTIKDPVVYATFLARLTHKNEYVRAISARALSIQKNAHALPHLIKALRDTSWMVREAVANSLGNLGDRGAVPALIRNLKDPKGFVRTASAMALGKMKDRRAIHSLRERLRDTDYSVSEAAVWALGEIGDRGAVRVLMRLLLTNGHPDVRRASARALGKIKDRRAVPSLLHALRSGLYRETVWALGEIGDKKAVPALVKLLNQKGGNSFIDDAARNVVIGALAKIKGAEAIQPLIESIFDNNTPAAIRTVVENALIQMGKSFLATKIKALWHRRLYKVGEVGLRSLIRILYEINRRYAETRVVPSLIAILHGPHTSIPIGVAKKAAEALGKIKDRRVVPALVRALSYDYSTTVVGFTSESSFVRDAAIKALVRMKAFSALHHTLKSCKDWLGRQSAAVGLGNLRDPRAIPLLMSSLNDRESIVRAKAVEALGEIFITNKRASKHHKGLIPALVRAIYDSSNYVRESAAMTFRNVDDPRIASALAHVLLSDRNREVREHAVDSLVHLADRRTVPALITALSNDRDNLIRAKSAQALGKIGDARAVPALISAVLHGPMWLGARMNAAEALGRIKDRRAVPALMTLIYKHSAYDDEILTAIKALGEISDKRVVPALISILFDPRVRPVTRVAARLVLRKFNDPLAVAALRSMNHNKLQTTTLPKWFLKP